VITPPFSDDSRFSLILFAAPCLKPSARNCLPRTFACFDISFPPPPPLQVLFTFALSPRGETKLTPSSFPTPPDLSPFIFFFPKDVVLVPPPEKCNGQSSFPFLAESYRRFSLFFFDCGPFPSVLPRDVSIVIADCTSAFPPSPRFFDFTKFVMV